MTVDAIAAAAEVSPKTVNALFGTKAEIIATIVDPDTFDPPIQHELERLRNSPTSVERLSLVVQISHHVFAALPVEFELLRAAAGVAPEVVELAERIDQRRRQRQFYAIQDLVERGQLHPDLTPEMALDILWSLTSYDLFRQLVLVARWSEQQYTHWLTTVLSQQLLLSSSQPGAGC
jgi:AcrR family transcriptional regulator